MSEHKIPIPSMIYNAAVGGHVTNSQQIIDENLNREQNDINQETVGAVPYNSTTPNGMGRIVLKKNDNFKQVAEAQTNGNTIFVIKYDFTLTDNVTVPANCVLEFDGGSISGAYTLTGTNTGIQAGLVKIFNTDINFAGSWNLGLVEVEWFGAKPDNTTNCTPAINKAISFINKGTIHFNNGTYCISNSIKIGPNINVIGINKKSTIIKKTTIENADDSVIELLNGSSSNHYGAIKNLEISGNNNNNDYGIQATKNSVPYLKIEDIDINNVKSGIYISIGTWLCTIKNVFIYKGEYGLYFNGTSTSCSLSNIYVMGVSKSAYYFTGVYYSSCDTLCADECTCSKNGVYELQFSLIDFSGCGCESCNSVKMINADNSTKATFTSCTFFSSNIENGTIINIHDASLKFYSCTLGSTGEHNSSIYKVSEISYCSFDNCSVNGTYTKENLSKGHIEINDKTGFTVFKNKQAGIGITGYIGKLAPTEKTRNIYTDGINKISSSVGHSEWSKYFRQGDIILNNYPKKNGIFAWESLNDPTIQKTLVGTISEIIASNKVKLTSLDYNTTQDDGIQIMQGDTLSFSNGYKGEITHVDYANNIITLWEPKGSASVGVGGILQISHYRMNNRFSAIQIISTGISTLRPSNPTTGICHFDETLNKPIWWNGTAWVDATGTSV